jgi:transcriptional regulator with XRE-family HTH domain
MLAGKWNLAPLLSTAQVRAARLLLGWTQSELGGQAGLSASAIGHFETGKHGHASVQRVSVIQRALESAGVIFVEENGEGPGVRLRKGR